MRYSVFLTGTLLLATFVGGARSQGNDKPTKVRQVVANWTPQVQFVPDTVHEGRPMPGIVGRLYLFGEQVCLPLAGDGTVHLELSAILPERPQDGWICLEKLDIDKESLKKVMQKDPLMAGPSYTMFLPWWSYRRDVTQIQMTLSYTPEKGTPLCSTSKFSLKPSVHDKPDTPDLDLVPSDCDGFATMRVAELADKLALKKVSDLPLLGEFEKHIGLRVTEMERFTLVVCAESRAVVGMIHTLRPCDRSRVLKALVPEAKEVKHRGKVIHVKNEEVAACFVNDRLILAGSEKNLRRILDSKGDRPTTGPLAEALARATTHDVVAWGRVIEPKEEPASTRSSYKTSRAPTEKVILGTLITPDGPSMLPGATSADLSLDIGKQMALQVCINFADEESAQRGVKYVRVGVEMLRAKIATKSAAFSLREVANELGIEQDEDASEIPPVLASLMKKTEKALQRVNVEAQGTTVPVSLTVPADAKTVASAALAWMKLSISEGSIFNFRDPNERIIELGNQSENLRQFQDEWERFWMLNHPSNLTFERIGGTNIQLEVLQIPPANLDSPAQSLPAPRQVVTPTNWSSKPTDAVSVAPVKLAIANVTKEPALLFLQAEGGKLTFERKVPAGEAIDVETPPGQRWVAIFADNPASENFVAAPDKTTWLLRGAPRNAIILPRAPAGSVDVAPPLAR